MKIYSDYAGRRTRQVTFDLIALALIAAWIWLGWTLYNLVMQLADFGKSMEQAGAGFRGTMKDIGDNLGGVPLIGKGIRAPFDGASDAGKSLEDAGQSQQEAVHQLALGLGIGIAVIPILMILVLWLIPRIRFVRKASTAKKSVSTGASLDLLALRALATQKLSALKKIDSDPLAAWRRGDPGVTRELASLELKSSGVKLRA